MVIKGCKSRPHIMSFKRSVCSCRKRLLAQGKMTEADYGGPLPPSDDDEPAGNEYKALGPRRRFLQRKEDRVLLWAWFR